VLYRQGSRLTAGMPSAIRGGYPDILREKAPGSAQMPAGAGGSGDNQRRCLLAREAAVTNGLILLGFIAVAFTLVMARARRRLGMAVTGRILAMTLAGFAIVVLVLWAATRH
jgi:hypothetical protein